MKPTICIGVPSYKRAAQLGELLQCLVPLVRERPYIRLCVVNDGSHNADYERVIAAYASNVDYRVSPKNGGCGAARRAAFEGATEDYLVCIDDDCMATREWLDWLEALIDAHPAVDLFAGDVRPYFEREPGDWERALSILDENISPVVFNNGLMTAVTANLAMKREAYERAGGFSADLRGAEDCDITQKLIHAGASYLVVPDWRIFHVAKLRYCSVARRFYQYGAHGAAYTLLRNFWMLALVHGEGSVAQSVKRAKERFDGQWRDDAGDKVLSWRTKCFRAIVVAALTFEYEMGWRRAMRRAGVTDHKGLPTPPVLADRYVDFSEAETLLLRAR